MKAFVLAHVSDLHVSTFGDTFHDRSHLVRRSARVADADVTRHEVAWEEAGWRVLRERARRGRVSLLDPEGYAHAVPSKREDKEHLDPIERAAAKACRLEARRAKTLAKDIPSEGALRHLSAGAPHNSNLRLLRAALAVNASQPDAVLVTGDLTDDGDGFELVGAAFAEARSRGALLAVPGNHDLYLFPMTGSGRPRPTFAKKREAWATFAKTLGLELHPTGAWTRVFDEGRVVIVGLDSCARPQRRFYRHNGAIGPEQLAYLREVAAGPAWKGARHKLVALHHHVVPLPRGVGRRAAPEIGMRLDDARTVGEVLSEVGATLVLHGHRHISEERTPAGSDFRLLAAPSLTLGCRSGDGPSFWRVELGERMHIARVRIPLDAVAHEEGADAEVQGEPEEPAEG